MLMDSQCLRVPPWLIIFILNFCELDVSESFVYHEFCYHKTFKARKRIFTDNMQSQDRETTKQKLSIHSWIGEREQRNNKAPRSQASPVFYLPFVFTWKNIQEWKPLQCIIVNANGKQKRWRSAWEREYRVWQWGNSVVVTYYVDE